MLQIPTKPEMTSPIRVRFQPQTIAALSVIVSYSPGDLSDHIRFAVQRYIEAEISQLERLVDAAEREGKADVTSQSQLAELRQAYQVDPDVT